jgi:hypothetical protein
MVDKSVLMAFITHDICEGKLVRGMIKKRSRPDITLATTQTFTHDTSVPICY